MAARQASKPEVAPAAAAAVESLFSRLIAGPVFFISFLVSLALVDRETSGKIFGKDARSKDGYYHSHQKKLGRQEMDDAFQIRSKVIMMFCLASGIALAVAGFGATRLWQLVWHQQ